MAGSSPPLPAFLKHIATCARHLLVYDWLLAFIKCSALFLLWDQAKNTGSSDRVFLKETMHGQEPGGSRPLQS